MRMMAKSALAVFALCALSGCSGAPPQASPSPTSTGVTFDEYRAANLDFVACIESHGGTVEVYEIDNNGVPDISNTVTGPRLTAAAGTPEYDAQIDDFLEWQDGCDASTVGPVRAAYQLDTARTGQQQETRAQRLENALPELRKCFAQEGADVDSRSTVDELRSAFHDATDDQNFARCFIELGLATDLGGGSYEIDF